MSVRICVVRIPPPATDGTPYGYGVLEELWLEQFDADGQPYDERTDEDVDDSNVWTADGKPIVMDVERAAEILDPEHFFDGGPITEDGDIGRNGAILSSPVLTQLVEQGYIELNVNAGTITLLRSRKLVRALTMVRH